MENKQDCRCGSLEFHFLSYSNLGKYFKVKNADWQILMQRPRFDALWGFCGAFHDATPVYCCACAGILPCSYLQILKLLQAGSK